MKANYIFTQTGIEPLTLEDAKLFLRIDQTSDDDLVTALVSSARTTAEKYLNKLIVQQTVTMTMDSLPCGGFKLAYGPVQSVTSVKVTDSSGAQTTWDASNYIVDTSGSRIVYTPTAVFPTTYQSINAMQVVYVAGYGLATDASTIPGGIVQALRHLMAATYENREVADAVPPLVAALLSPFRKLVI